MRIPVTLRADPWSAEEPEALDLWLPPQATLADAVAAVVGELAEEPLPVLALVNGRPVPAELWPAERLATGLPVSLTALPRGNVGRIIATAAVIVAALYFPGALGLTGFAAAATGAAITIGGTLLVNALFPVPVPSGGGLQPSSGGLTRERWVTSASTNRLRPWGRRTLVLGSMRWEPDLLTRQIAAPSTGSADNTAVSGGVLFLHPRVDRVLVADLGLGDLRIAPASGAAVRLPAAPERLTAELVAADGEDLVPEWGVRPGALIVLPSGLLASSAWPLRARWVNDEPHPLAGASVSIDAVRSAPTLVAIIGGTLYDSSSSGALTTGTFRVTATGSQQGAPDIREATSIRNAALSPEYGAISFFGGEREWVLAGDPPPTSTRSRAEISIAQQVWLASPADIAASRTHGHLLGVRLAGGIGVPPRRTIRVFATQAVPVPSAAGVWSGAVASRNPAAILRAFTLGWHADDGTLLAGTGRPPDTVDDAVLTRWYRWCDAHVPPLRCDLALVDDARPAEAIERLIAATGRAEISWRTGRLGVVWADRDDAPEGLVHPSQILPGSLSSAWRSGPDFDVIVADYLDRTTWDGAEVRAVVPGRTPARERQIALEGVTDTAAARFHAASAAADEAYHRRVINWRMGREGCLLTRGSLWLLAWDPAEGGASGRVASIEGAEVTLDRPVRVASNGWLALDVPGEAGVHQSSVTSRSGLAEEVRTLVMTAPYHPAAEVGQRDVLWRYYDLDRPPTRVRILAARPTSETEWEIQAREERDEYWREVDKARAVDPPIIVGPLPDPVRITASGDWHWPAEWPADVTQAIVRAYGAGAGGGRGNDGGARWSDGSGSRGGDTTVTAGAVRITGPGGVGLGVGGSGGAGGEAGVGFAGSGVSGSNGQVAAGGISRDQSPVTVVIGRGGAGQPVRPPGSAAGQEWGGAGGRGADGWVVIQPIR